MFSDLVSLQWLLPWVIDIVVSVFEVRIDSIYAISAMLVDNEMMSLCLEVYPVRILYLIIFITYQITCTASALIKRIIKSFI